MKIEIITIGNELLSGKTINSNTQYISKTLLKFGYRTHFASVYPDEKKELENGIKAALKRADLLIITGGLGPTIDDNTKEIVTNLLKIDLKFSGDIASDIEKRFGQIASLQEQSTIPKSGFVFKNEVGTAPGFAFLHYGKALILLPGVPVELEDMFEKHAMVFIQKHFPIKEKIYQEIINICLLAEIKIDALLKTIQLPDDITLGIYPSYGFVQVSITTKALNKMEATKKISDIKNQIALEFAEYIYISEDGKIERALHDLLIKKEEKIAFAESCTGGALSAKIVKLSDSSKYFLGSFITYSNELKKNILKVSEKTLLDHGAVSLPTVKEMIKGVFDLTDATYAIAVSGIAGPGGATEEKPIGTISLAVAKRGDEIDAGFLHLKGSLKGSRSSIIESSANIAFGILYRKIAHNLNYFEK
ncbi:MAG: Nicotinamide-nucleotide amidohydrolase PncC [Candidatus Anoxychlamydiales bacterium]|nr:Nicotinamide-nucleotide amidohydrolase PncC [Candidatus Anoxychlamydiales bacterium]